MSTNYVCVAAVAADEDARPLKLSRVAAAAAALTQATASLSLACVGEQSKMMMRRKTSLVRINV